MSRGVPICGVLYDAAMAGGWPLVGRDEETRLLAAAVTAGGGAVICGAAGVGKSRLAAEVAASLPADRHWTEPVRATRATASIPFGPYAHHLGAVGTEPLGRLEVVARVAAELVRRADGRRLLLVVDDAHLLDEGSAALTLHLVERLDAAAVVTLRQGERAHDAVQALWKEDLLLRVELDALTEEGTAALLDVMLDGPVEPAAAAEVWSRSHGNPLYVREVVRAACDQGVLGRGADGRWRWRGGLRPHQRLADVVQDRLAGLAAGPRTVVELVALGEPVPRATLAALAPADAVVEAEERGLVALSDADARLAHPLYGEVVRASVGQARRRDVLLRLAASLAHDPAELVRVATWRLEADDPDADPAEFLAAARRAMAMADDPLALRLADAALAHGAGPRAVLLRADALWFTGRAAEASGLLADLTRDAALPDDVRRDAAIVLATALCWGLGHVDAAEAVLDEAGPRLGPADAAEVRAYRASIAFFGGRVGEAAAAAEAVLVDTCAGNRARVRAITIAIAAWACQGRLAAACGAADVALEPSLALADELPEEVGDQVLARCIALMTGGLLDEADAVLRAIHDLAPEQRRRDFQAPLDLLVGRLAYLRGDLAGASARLNRAAEVFATHDPQRFAPWCHGLRALVAAQQGRADDAASSLDEAAAASNPAIRVFEADVTTAAAWMLAARGELASARRVAAATAAEAVQAGMNLAAATAWHDLARLGGPDEAAEPLAALAQEMEGPLPAAFAAHAAALAAGDGAALDEVCDAFAAMGARLFAAEAAAAAALAHRREGRMGSHVRARDRARSLTAACGGAATPTLRLLDAEAALADGLTEREREVVELAARGLSNREISERLVVSIRTVNNHLNHVYTKLGLSDRAELALALTPPPSP